MTRPDPADRVAFDAHCERVLSDPENWTRAIDEDGVLVGMIASVTMEDDPELTYWVDPSRWARHGNWSRATPRPGGAFAGRSTRELRSTTLARVGYLSGTDSRRSVKKRAHCRRKEASDRTVTTGPRYLEFSEWLA